MANILEEIVERKKPGLENARRILPLDVLRGKAIADKASHKFLAALSSGTCVNIIAEIKKASPSKGVLRADFNPVVIARAYATAGAAAISVLTEENYFQGSLDHLRQVKTASGLPVLRKDFLTDEYQIYEARVHGADAVLLIAALLDAKKISSMIAAADELGMDCLVEVHSAAELETVLSTRARIIGINNRDLSTFTVSLETAKVLSKMIPKDRVIVVESGIETRDDIQMYGENGINCFLIGEAFMKSNDINAKFKELTNG